MNEIVTLITIKKIAAVIFAIMKQHWDARYRETEFAYGETPNVWVKDCLSKIEPHGTLLFPAEGEGRNSVYAETLGWKTKSFDMSQGGKEKAVQLADKNGLTYLDYEVITFQEVQLEEASFDGVIFNYTHFPESMKSSFFEKMLRSVKPQGYVVFECFSKNNLPFRKKNPKVGGPDKEEMLYTVDELTQLFGSHFRGDIFETQTTLNEGKYHIGEAMVIRAFGRLD